MAEETQKEENVAEVETETVETEATEEVKEPAEEKGMVEANMKEDLPGIRPGDTVKVHQKIKEKNKDRIQVFEGQVLARKHGKGISSTITVRKVIDSIGVEKIFPLHSPSIEKIEIVRHAKARRAKLYYLRGAKGRKSKLKTAEKEGE